MNGEAGFDRGCWFAIACFLGVFGGLCAAYIIGVPITFLLPILLVHFARYRGLGAQTMVWYGVGIALVPTWIIGASTVIDGRFDATGGMVVISVGLVLIATIMIAASQLNIVRGHRSDRGRRVRLASRIRGRDD